MHAAALLSQLLYWTDRAASPEGWVYKTGPEWGSELGLTRHELETARGQLRARRLTQESCHLIGARRMLHMRLCVEKLLAALDALPAGPDVPSAHASTDAFPDRSADLSTAPAVPAAPAPPSAPGCEPPPSLVLPAPPDSATEPNAVPTAPADSGERVLAPKARAFLRSLDGLAGKQLEDRLQGHMRDLIPGLQTEPEPGSSAWKRDVRLLPEDLPQRIRTR